MKRNTLAKQIAAQPDTSGALEMSRYRHKLSAIERAAANHLLWRGGFDVFAKQAKDELAMLIFRAIDCASPELKQLTPMERAAYRSLTPAEMKKAKSSFRTEVLTAANMLRELADFVENYHRSSNAETPADLLRTKLLILKQCCEDGIKPHTIAEIAAMLGMPETEDGYSQLRRMCRKLNLPVANARQTNK